MTVLHLNLKKKWFDMIASGEKKEEYREIKPYWTRRLIGEPGNWKGYTSIIFSNGYAISRNQLEIKCKGLIYSHGREEWGAVEGQIYYVLLLGEIL